MADDNTKGGMFSNYIEAAKKAIKAKEGLSVKKEVHQMPGVQYKAKVTMGTRKLDTPEPPGETQGWQSTAKLFEDDEAAKNDRTKTITLKPATKDEIFSK